MKKILQNNLQIKVEMEDECYNFISIKISLGREVISETTHWI